MEWKGSGQGDYRRNQSRVDWKGKGAIMKGRKGRKGRGMRVEGRLEEIWVGEEGRGERV